MTTLDIPAGQRIRLIRTPGQIRNHIDNMVFLETEGGQRAISDDTRRRILALLANQYDQVLVEFEEQGPVCTRQESELSVTRCKRLMEKDYTAKEKLVIQVVKERRLRELFLEHAKKQLNVGFFKRFKPREINFQINRDDFLRLPGKSKLRITMEETEDRSRIKIIYIILAPKNAEAPPCSPPRRIIQIEADPQNNLYVIYESLDVSPHEDAYLREKAAYDTRMKLAVIFKEVLDLMEKYGYTA